MYQMKRLLTLLLIGLMTISGAMAAEESEPLSVLEMKVDYNENISNTYYIELASQPVVTCYHQVMTVQWQDAEQGWQSIEANVNQNVSMRLLRASEMPNAVTSPKDPSSTVLFDVKEPGIVRVRGMERGTHVQAYATDGRTVATAVAAANGEAIINLKSQARGMYVISVNQRETFKI